MMSERIELPADSDVDAQRLAEIAFAIEHLPHERLAARHVHVEHDIGAADDRQSSFLHELEEGGLLFRISLQERLDVTGLIEHEAVVGVGSSAAAVLAGYSAVPCRDILHAS